MPQHLRPSIHTSFGHLMHGFSPATIVRAYVRACVNTRSFVRCERWGQSSTPLSRLGSQRWSHQSKHTNTLTCASDSHRCRKDQHAQIDHSRRTNDEREVQVASRPTDPRTRCHSSLTSGLLLGQYHGAVRSVVLDFIFGIDHRRVSDGPVQERATHEARPQRRLEALEREHYRTLARLRSTRTILANTRFLSCEATYGCVRFRSGSWFVR